MAKVSCSRVVLHNTMMLGGANLTSSLPAHRTGMVMNWDTDERMLEVTWNKETAHVCETNIAYMIFGEQKVHAPIKLPTGKPIEAQVSTPTSHVFAEMKGKTKA